MTEKELRKLNRKDLLELLVEQSREAARLGLALGEREEELAVAQEQLERLKGKLDEKDASLEKLKGRLNEKDASLEKLKGRLDEKDALLEKLKGRLDKKDALLEKLKGRLDEKDALIEQKLHLEGGFPDGSWVRNLLQRFSNE